MSFLTEIVTFWCTKISSLQWLCLLRWTHSLKLNYPHCSCCPDCSRPARLSSRSGWGDGTLFRWRISSLLQRRQKHLWPILCILFKVCVHTTFLATKLHFVPFSELENFCVTWWCLTWWDLEKVPLTSSGLSTPTLTPSPKRTLSQPNPSQPTRDQRGRLSPL